MMTDLELAISNQPLAVSFETLGSSAAKIHQNPVERGLVHDSREYRYCSALPGYKLDPWPSAAKAGIIHPAQTGTSGTRALPGSTSLHAALNASTSQAVPSE